MKLTLNTPGNSSGHARRRWPSHLFGGRVRTSTLALIMVFVAVWWVYDTYRPHEPSDGGTPPTQVVPPGFVPDPNYTWVPRTRVEEPLPTYRAPRTTPAPRSTTPLTTTSPTSPPETTPPAPPPPPCLLPPPFCPEETNPTTPEPGPSLSSPPPVS